MSNRRMISADLFEDDYIYSVDYVARFAWIGLIVSCAGIVTGKQIGRAHV